ncbi:3395_t:CDS:2 [Ambispora leptoticha]|uniref:3395_t:CDS:1 n=1 Tax=Ambispora leptoticha TaxID=144679 RepID=A0A9N9AL85_9GLOM|nr:3395_t:CDS:2 [Ambispora leptoticha]
MNSHRVETNFIINTLGTYYLTKSKFPLMQKTGLERELMYTNKLTSKTYIEIFKPFDSTMAYVQTKRQQYYLCSILQGNDPILWAAFSEEAENVPSGAFIFDREVASTHLPLARTRSEPEDIGKLVNEIVKYGLEESSATSISP